MGFDAQPHLLGDNVELRPLRESDFDELYAAASDPLIWEQHPDDRHREDVFRAFFAESLASGAALVAIERRTGEIVGSSRYHGYDADRREVEIGWTFLVRSLWGGAFNLEMKQLMLEHALRFVDRVLFLVGQDNIRSQRAGERSARFASIRARTRAGERASSTRSGWCRRRARPGARSARPYSGVWQTASMLFPSASWTYAA